MAILLGSHTAKMKRVNLILKVNLAGEFITVDFIGSETKTFSYICRRLTGGAGSKNNHE